MYSVEATMLGRYEARHFTTAEQAMKLVNELSVRHTRDMVIRNGSGRRITEQQLAMIVMEQRIVTERLGVAG